MHSHTGFIVRLSSPTLITSCVLLAYIHSVVAQSGGSGAEEGDHSWLADCESCIKDIYIVRWAEDTCQSITPVFAACMETCWPEPEPEKDPINTAHVQALSWMYGILERLRMGQCWTEEESLFLANGCTSKVLSCVQHVANPSSYSIETLGDFNCSEEASTAMYTCFEDESDCIWRSPLEILTSKARRSICESNDRCVSNGNLYLGEQHCQSFRLSSLHYLDYMLSQRPMLTPSGTLFSAQRCSIVHGWGYNCPY